MWVQNKLHKISTAPGAPISLGLTDDSHILQYKADDRSFETQSTGHREFAHYGIFGSMTGSLSQSVDLSGRKY